QELDLHLGRQLADLVQEDRAAVRELEATRPALGGTREGAALVTEELALDEPARQRRTVDLDERPAAARAPRVDRARDQLLSSAGLAEDEDRGVRRRHQIDLLEGARQRPALPDDLLEVVDGLDLVLEVTVLAVQLAQLLLRALAFLHVAQDEGEERPPRHLDPRDRAFDRELPAVGVARPEAVRSVDVGPGLAPRLEGKHRRLE